MIVLDKKSKLKRAFLHRILLALTIVTAVNIIYFTHSGRAQGGITMKKAFKGVSAVTVKNCASPWFTTTTLIKRD
jgi:hypothetical protein